MQAWRAAALTERDVDNGRVRPESGRAGLRHAGGDDAVQEERERRDGGAGRRARVERDGVRLEDVGGEEVAAVSGEVVVDGETALQVERLRRCRLGKKRRKS